MKQIIPHSKNNFIVTRWDGEWRKFQIVAIDGLNLITTCGKGIPRKACMPANDYHPEQDLIIPWAMGAVMEEKLDGTPTECWVMTSSPRWLPQGSDEVGANVYRPVQITPEQWEMVEVNEEIKSLEEQLRQARSRRDSIGVSR